MGPNFFMAVGFLILLAIVAVVWWLDSIFNPKVSEYFYVWQQHPFDDYRIFVIRGAPDQETANERAREFFQQKRATELSCVSVPQKHFEYIDYGETREDRNMKCPVCDAQVNDVHFHYKSQTTKSDSDLAQIKPCSHHVTRSDNRRLFQSLEKKKSQQTQRKKSGRRPGGGRNGGGSRR